MDDDLKTNSFFENGLFPGGDHAVEFIETHISWVILCEQYAYKLKKPIHYPFLDFSTLEKRKFYCYRELELNQRLAPEVYLDVVGVCRTGDGYLFGCKEGGVVEYAVKMKKLDHDRRMDVLAGKNQIHTKEVAGLANLLAEFHQTVSRPEIRLVKDTLVADFDDLFSVRDWLRVHLDIILDDLEGFADHFWNKHFSRIEARQQAGFLVDGHGDLHTRNIFLYPDRPIIFDCIEFNDSFRQIDVLSEIGFLLMDLENFGKSHLADHFLKIYNLQYKVLEKEEDVRLLEYFKLYRANVRLKVYALKAMQGQKEKEDLPGYWFLMKKYLKNLKAL